MSSRNPTAGIVIYNYLDRGGSDKISNQNYEKIVLTKSIVSIQTSKSKSNPAGRFQVVLAPTKNWSAALSTGSWIEIHMSPNQMTEGDLNDSSRHTLKMIGIVDSVRMSMTVDQVTGARSTDYVIVGRDWGSIFESYLYIDSTVESSVDSPFLNAVKLSYQVLRGGDVDLKLNQSTTELTQSIVKAWGLGVALGIYKDGKLDNAANNAVYRFPNQLSAKLRNPAQDTNPLGVKSIAHMINVVDGTLKSQNAYLKNIKEAQGPFNAEALRGINTVWQLINTHANTTINELLTDLRWENNEQKPTLTLYKRVKPFWLKNETGFLRSNFFLLKSAKINKNDIVALDVGTNSEDIINFVAVYPDFSLFSLKNDETIGSQAAAKSRVPQYDPQSFARHGFKPLTYTSRFVPLNESRAPNWEFLTQWGKLLAAWYFDTHKMLNGTISIVGQNEFIGVGDNIMFEASTLGHTSFVDDNGQSMFVAHVESVSHAFRYVENGSRSFITTINFVRGVMANANGTALVSGSSFGVETKVKELTAHQLDIEDAYGE
jgi:hypothetical protein